MSTRATPADDGAVLVVNAGSSSLKFGVYPRQGPALLVGHAQGLEPGGRPRLAVAGEPEQPLDAADSQAAFDAALALLGRRIAALRPAPRLVAVAHRVVHGGKRFAASRRLDNPDVAELEGLAPLAPLHQPHNLAGVRACAARWPNLPQIGCFDTAFHATLPEVERRLPLPTQVAGQGLQRYGFHGLSYRFVVDTLRERSARWSGRALLAHLGNGASLCATREGRSVATTMGLSALDGLMMGTRCGSLDPGVLLHLWRAGWTLEQVEQLLYAQSGLKGVSGLSADMRVLRASDNPAAQTAIELFIHRIVREAGALTALLGGLDLLAFTGGIGEHDALLRDDLAQRFAWLGVRVDAAANRAARGDAVVPIHAADSSVELWVVPTDEGRVAARDTFAVIDRATAA